MIFRNNRNGFTFIEIMVALSVLALIITSVFRLYSQSISMLMSTDFYMKAPLLSEKTIIKKKYGKDELLNDQGSFDNLPDFSWQTKESIIDISSYLNIAEEIKNIKIKKVEVIISDNTGREYKTFFLKDYEDE